MADNLQLDPDTLRRLVSAIDHDLTRGHFQLNRGSVFTLDAHGGDPERTSLLRDLKTKLDFVDFDSGGLKMLEVDIRGAKARFSLLPRWEPPAQGTKGFGGPSVSLQLKLEW
jgi:hypothetical protein